MPAAVACTFVSRLSFSYHTAVAVAEVRPACRFTQRPRAFGSPAFGRAGASQGELHQCRENRRSRCGIVPQSAPAGGNGRHRGRSCVRRRHRALRDQRERGSPAHFQSAAWPTASAAAGAASDTTAAVWRVAGQPLAGPRAAARRHESLRRHFLTVALAPMGLPPSMVQATPQRLLVALSGHSNTRVPRLAGARVGTIPLPVIAAPAHPQLALTARTVQQAVAGTAHRPTSSPHQAGASPRGSWGRRRALRVEDSSRLLGTEPLMRAALGRGLLVPNGGDPVGRRLA